MNDYFIKNSVGNMMENEEEDVSWVKSALYNLGFRKNPPQNGIIEQETDEAIREFQKAKGLKVDGYLLAGGETEKAIKDGIKKNILDNKPKWMNAPEINFALDRKESIINDRPARFGVKEDYSSDPKEPWHEFGITSEVEKYADIMDRLAQKYAVDPDLVKAIAYLETTHGPYDRLTEPFDANKTIRPMNIHSDYWKDLGYSREDLKDPEKNIDAGIKLIKLLSDRIPNSSVRTVATLYNNLGAEEVSRYGARVGSIYKEKPWKKAKR